MIQGLGTQFGVSEETTYGTAIATPANFFEVEEGFESIEMSRNLGEPSMLDGASLDKSQVTKLRRLGGGGIDIPLRYDNAWLIFLAHLIGKDVATTGTGPYVHTLDLGATPDIVSKGITTFVKRSGLVPGGSTKTWQYFGYKPTSVELIIPEEGVASISVDGFCKDLNFVSHTTASYASGGWIQTPSLATSPTALFTWAGTTYIVTSATVRFERVWTQRWDPIDDTMLAPAIGGMVKITASISVEALDTNVGSGGALFDDYKAKTFRPVVITIDGGTPASEALAISLGSCLITAPVVPHPGSAEVMTSNLEITAYRNGSTSAGSLVLTNGASAAWS